MAVEDPGTLTVTCDECGEQDEFETTEFAGDPASFGVEDHSLEQKGWKRDGGTTFCKDCAAHEVCETCDGSGVVQVEGEEDEDDSDNCPDCGGSGVIEKDGV